MEDKATDKTDVQAAPRPAQGARRAFGVAGIVATVVAWVTYYFSGVAALVLAVIGLLASIVGTTHGKGCLRDLAITSIIASAVLIVLVCLFIFGLPWLLG